MAKARKVQRTATASGVRALLTAASHNDVRELQSLRTDGVDLNARSSGGSSALHEAVGTGALKAVQFLIDAGADLNLLDKDEMTPLMTACHTGKTRGSAAALLLIRAGADVRCVRAGDEMTALKFAVRQSTPAVLQALLDAGAAVDGPPGTDQTALMLAARANNVPALAVLVKNGADASLPCKLPWAEGRTAEGLAELEKQRKALDYLRRVRCGLN